MQRIDNIEVFYSLPQIVDRPHSIEWRKQGKLERYINNRGDLELEALFYQLARELSQSPADSQQPESLIKNSVSAVSANIVLKNKSKGFNWIKHDLYPEINRIYNSAKSEAKFDLKDILLDSLSIIFTRPLSLLPPIHLYPNSTEWVESFYAKAGSNFQRLLIDRLRCSDRFGEYYKRTNLGILTTAKTSNKRVSDALKEAGEVEPRLSSLKLLYSCLNEVKKANQFSAEKPTSEHFATLLSRYQERETSIPIVSNEEEVRELLDKMGRTIRNYRDRSLAVDSLDRTINLESEGSNNLVDKISAPSLSEVEEEQYPISYLKLRDRLIQIAENLPVDRDRLLLLYYGLQMTQVEMGNELGVNQTTVMRRVDSTIGQLLSQLSSELKIEVNLSSLALIKGCLEDVFKIEYQQKLRQIIDRKSIKLPSNITSLSDRFIQEIQTRWQFQFRPEGEGVKKAQKFVNQYLDRGGSS